MFDEIIQKDKKFAPVLRKIKAVYTYEIQAHQTVELREYASFFFISIFLINFCFRIRAAHDDLVIEHNDLQRKYRQLGRDNEVMRKNMQFRNDLVYQLEEVIGNFLNFFKKISHDN